MTGFPLVAAVRAWVSRLVAALRGPRVVLLVLPLLACAPYGKRMESEKQASYEFGYKMGFGHGRATASNECVASCRKLCRCADERPK